MTTNRGINSLIFSYGQRDAHDDRIGLAPRRRVAERAPAPLPGLAKDLEIMNWQTDRAHFGNCIGKAGE